VFFLFALFGFPPVLEIKFDNLYFKDILSFFFGGTRTFKILTLSPVYVCVYVTGMMNIFLSVNVYVLCHAFFFFLRCCAKIFVENRAQYLLFIIVTCFSLFLFF